ncbi:voltage-gated potassium channel [Zhouia amylolytica]|uniref:K+ transport system, NAD-binding component n=2 Tax=Zhouia amylolytica TaxID=376730 RepID=W2UTR2_9FLAO|nr:potassium channel protein [Zhouia amylolytica]ETN96916.1 k+ transport system, NAD-binding component [Zhouia amylolytica AD3]SFS91755.1 voltage-gated potassium channel [Zhouia amylolytica]
MFKLFRSKFYIAIALLVFVFLFGIFGYRYFGEYNWIDAVYMTVITVTTVGFSEVRPLDGEAKIFTIILIISSVFIFAFAISIITEFLLVRSTVQQIKLRKMKRKINQLKDHVIICGYGRNGKQAALKLLRYKKPFVVIESNEEVIEKEQDDQVLFILGNANEDEVLLEAGIEKAQVLITALPNDADNLFVVLSARQLNKGLNIISRASEESSQRKLTLAGADRTIMPDKIGGDHMASLVVLPDLVEFVRQLAIEGKDTITLEEVSMDDLPEKYKYKSLIDLNLRSVTGCTVIGYKEASGDFIINPEGDTKLLPNCKLVVLGRPEQIKKLNEMFNIKESFV